MENLVHTRDKNWVLTGQVCGDGWKQLGFSDYELATAKKQTKRENILSEMEALAP